MVFGSQAPAPFVFGVNGDSNIKSGPETPDQVRHYSVCIVSGTKSAGGSGAAIRTSNGEETSLVL